MAVPIAQATSGAFLTIFGKWALRITLFFILLLLIQPLYNGIAQKSMQPIVMGFVDLGFRILSADHIIGASVDALPSIKFYDNVSFFSTQWWVNSWNQIVFWFNVMISLWFMFAVIYFLYFFVFRPLDTTKVAVNITLSILVFCAIQLPLGAWYYHMSLAGTTLPKDKSILLQDDVFHSLPFQGTYRLITHIINRDLFTRVNNFVNSPAGSIITGIPNATVT